MMEWALVVEEDCAFVESGERLSSERNDWRYPGYDMIMCISHWLLTKHRFLCNSVIYDADYKVIRISNEYVLFVILFVLGECLYACMYSVGWLMYATAQQSQLFPFVRNWVSRRPESMCRGILPACLADSVASCTLIRDWRPLSTAWGCHCLLFTCHSLL